MTCQCPWYLKLRWRVAKKLIGEDTVRFFTQLIMEKFRDHRGREVLSTPYVAHLFSSYPEEK